MDEDDWGDGPAARAGFGRHPQDNASESSEDEGEDSKEENPALVGLYASRAKSPGSVQCHESLVAGLRKAGGRAKQLRAAREAWSAAHPLTPQVPP